ncbi:LacI family DNA-binding transcriptional regulator [Puia sp. P3]|uniref:LacI family DNA-binding transcriptional regulator n=1 Tax=Puia sp. P3 TaxID=3423952 RepID=UPI003D66C396
MQNKIPTIQEIARILKLSKSTVSRALRDHPAIGLRTTQRVQQLGQRTQLRAQPDGDQLFEKENHVHRGHRFITGRVFL